MTHRIFAFIAAVVVLAGGSVLRTTDAAALSGNCANNPYNYFSVVCLQSSYPYTGNYGKWYASVPLNISQSAASLGYFIAEALWMYDLTTPSAPTWLEIGDTSGGSAIQGHVNEWARMHYYVDGSRGSLNEKDYFYRYAPLDGQMHQFGIQRTASFWEICFDGYCPTTFTWRDPNLMTTTMESGGLEVGLAGQPLNTSLTNSGTFQLNTMLLRNSVNVWDQWPSALTQVDRACGAVPCLQGWWAAPPPPYDNWNNGEPTQ